MTIFEIADDYVRLLEMAEDPDVDPQVIADTLEGIEGEFEDKVEACACVMDQLGKDIDAIDDEMRRLQARKNAMKNNRANIGERVMAAMRLTGKLKIRTATRTVSVMRNSVPSITVNVDVWAVPEEYRRYKDPEIDLRKIGKDIKDGKDIPFAHVEYGFHLRYK